MKTTVTALTSLLLAFVLSGTAVGSLPEIELPEETVPTGGIAGQSIGCNIEDDGGPLFGYGKPGVPSSTGYNQAPCDFANADQTGEVTHSVLKTSGDYGFTSAFGVDTTTWDHAQIYISCADPATLLVDWTGEDPEVTYLDGADCLIGAAGTANIEDVTWKSSGGGRGADVKFAHTDNLADALVHLLS